jgi:hypothetical protein
MNVAKLKKATIQAVKEAYQLGRYDGNMEKRKLEKRVRELEAEIERLNKVREIERELETG